MRTAAPIGHMMKAVVIEFNIVASSLNKYINIVEIITSIK